MNNKNTKKNEIMLSILVISIGLLLAAGTFALLSVNMDITNGTYNTVTGCFAIDYDPFNNGATNLITGISDYANGIYISGSNYMAPYDDERFDGAYFDFDVSSPLVLGKEYVFIVEVSGLHSSNTFMFGFPNKNSNVTQLVNGVNKIYFDSWNTSSGDGVILDEVNISTVASKISFKNFQLYETSNLDITGTMFPSASPNKGLNGRVGFKANSTCNVPGTGSLNLHVNSGFDTKILTVATSYCYDKYTGDRYTEYTTESACTTAGYKWKEYPTNWCENKNTLEMLREYTDSSTCTSNNGIWRTSGSPLKYAIYNNATGTGTPLSVGNITTSDVGHDIVIANNLDVTSTQQYYYIFIWLDGYLTDDTYVDLPFSGYINATVVQRGSNS